MKAVFAIVLVGLALAAAPTEAPHPGMETLKSLEGRWVGPAVWDRGGEPGSAEFDMSYRVTSGGHAVLETMMPETPGEMVTMYYLDGGDLVLIHYCNAGNQPRMVLESASDPSDLSFRCLGGTNMSEADSHMHSARLRIVDSDHLQGEWSSVKGGVVQWVARAELVRQK
jgi:hypothetical protein